MTEQPREKTPGADKTPTVHELLLQMDLATEILEGLDELGLDYRAQVEALLATLERQIADSA